VNTALVHSSHEADVPYPGNPAEFTTPTHHIAWQKQMSMSHYDVVKLARSHGGPWGDAPNFCLPLKITFLAAIFLSFAHLPPPKKKFVCPCQKVVAGYMPAGKYCMPSTTG